MEFDEKQPQMILVTLMGKRFLLPMKKQVVIGRKDPYNEFDPDIDTTAIGGEEHGVSRKHAQISKDDNRYTIEDLGSTNSTYVNRRRLVPKEVCRLRVGDEIRVGRISLIFARG